uniref:hypothetical protein n=1 Tax=Mycoplasmopsis bovis TaxID=28903 RepID=UPI003D265A77
MKKIKSGEFILKIKASTILACYILVDIKRTVLHLITALLSYFLPDWAPGPLDIVPDWAPGPLAIVPDSASES